MEFSARREETQQLAQIWPSRTMDTTVRGRIAAMRWEGPVREGDTKSFFSLIGLQSSQPNLPLGCSQIAAIAAAAEEPGMVRHMDGARFGNAVAALGCHPADITWRAGVQLLSFGASKNGCLAAEALLIFDDRVAADTAERLRKRSGHLLSKMRYVSAQLLAYLEQDLWLDMAGHANAQATRFAQAVDRHPEASLTYTVEANEVFVRWSPAGFRRLEAAGIQFLTWPGRDDLARFVFSHCTTPAETEALCNAFAEAGAG